jgi:uncharacterized protein (TIGR03435 family)
MWSYLKRTAGLVGALALLGVASVGQDVSDNLQFDVVSVKLNNSPNAQQSLRVTPGRASATNIPLRTIIQFAFQAQKHELVNAPAWIDVERFDILATAPPSSSIEQMRVMLRNMLVYRFKLVARKEKREIPIYALVLSRRDGKVGPNMKASEVDCTANASRGIDQIQTARPVDPEKRCQILPMFGEGRFIGRGLHMENIASALNNLVDRPIFDKTGLSGPFEFDLKWTPDALAQVNTGTADVNGPSLFTAMQEQLGLKLDSQRDQADVLVIDRVERPTPD